MQNQSQNLVIIELCSLNIANANIALEDTLGIRIFRDPTDEDDTYGSAAALAWVEFLYTAKNTG